MGFYSPAVLIKDAQRHGLRVRPLDVQRSEGLCTLEPETDGSLSLRIGFNYAKGLKKTSADRILFARSEAGMFASVDDIAQRVPELNRKELVLLAGIGALNSLGEVEHRRDAIEQRVAGLNLAPFDVAPCDGHPQGRPRFGVRTGRCREARDAMPPLAVISFGDVERRRAECSS